MTPVPADDNRQWDLADEIDHARDEAPMRTLPAGGQSIVAAVKVTPRRDFERKLAHAHAQLDDSITKVKRALTSVELWRRRVKHYERQIAQRDHPKPKTLKAPKKTRRIKLDETT